MFEVALFFFSLVDFLFLRRLRESWWGALPSPSVLVQQPQQCSAEHKAEPELAAHATGSASSRGSRRRQHVRRIGSKGRYNSSECRIRSSARTGNQRKQQTDSLFNVWNIFVCLMFYAATVASCVCQCIIWFASTKRCFHSIVQPALYDLIIFCFLHVALTPLITAWFFMYEQVVDQLVLLTVSY